MDSVKTEVIAMIARQKDIQPESISLQSTFEELEVDSLDKANLTYELGECYRIVIPDESLHSLRTVGDAVDGVHRLLREQEDAFASAPSTEPA